jgi:C1A family cysteine protease
MGLTDDFQPSRAFIYWYARHVPRLGWENQDEGAMPRDAMQTMISNGVVSEEDWPFNPKKINTEPTSGLLSKAKAHRITEGHYVRMTAADNLFHLKLSLSKELPFLIGIAVYSSFYDTRSDGMVSMPKTSETYEGGHLLWCCGFSNSMHRFICPNSWGEGEGDKGYFYLPYEYVAEPALAGDFWRIELVS